MPGLRELTPTRLSEGGAVLLLRDLTGVEYAVPVDARLRDVLGHSLGRPTGPGEPRTHPTAPETSGARQKEPTMESSLRPREIQDRIRAGESAEDLAAVGDTPVEKVMAFAGPVLAERAHVARTALEASVRRTAEAGPGAGPGGPGGPGGSVRTLGQAARTQLREHGADPEALDWDAWRREDGRWTLEATYRADGEARRGRFVFDQRGHFVSAADDEGRWLVGDAPRSPVSAPAADRPDATDDTGLPGPRLRLAPAPVGSRPETGAVFGAPGDDLPFDFAEWDDTPAAEEEPVRVEEPVSAQERPRHEDSLPLAELTGPPPGTPAVDQDPQDREDTAGLARRHPRKQRGRASVPSWDEIMFGGGE